MWRGLLLGILLVFFPVSEAWAGAPTYYHPDILVSGNAGDTIITFIGFASPDAFLTFYDYGSVIGTDSANLLGNFVKSFPAQTPGVHSYSITSEDVNGRTTPSISYVVYLNGGTTKPKTEIAAVSILNST